MYTAQAAAGLSQEKLEEYKSIFSFFDRYFSFNHFFDRYFFFQLFFWQSLSIISFNHFFDRSIIPFNHSFDRYRHFFPSIISLRGILNHFLAILLLLFVVAGCIPEAFSLLKSADRWKAFKSSQNEKKNKWVFNKYLVVNLYVQMDNGQIGNSIISVLISGAVVVLSPH